MRILAILLAALMSSLCVNSEPIGRDSPLLLLNAQQLRRLKRDWGRQTVRWVNFESRVHNVSDSSQRGLELALYYAVTGDKARGQEAVRWAEAHSCDRTQVAIVLDWCSDLITEEDRNKLAGSCEHSEAAKPLIQSARDSVFLNIAMGSGIDGNDTRSWKGMLASLQRGQFRDGDALIAACEYLAVVRATTHQDLREEDRAFFVSLPREFLLAMKPSELEHPEWKRHVAGLALVSLDPNLEGSQYVQGWAIEDRQMIRDGPGVAFELLWGDPYLPGIAYQNMDPWFYDAAGQLFARADWDPQTCWISVAPRDVETDHCPPRSSGSPLEFGTMRLVPAAAECTEVPARKESETVILWKLQPAQALTAGPGKQTKMGQADVAGMWRVPENVTGKVCQTRDSHSALP